MNKTILKQPGFKTPYLWLQIKKSGGTSLRHAFGNRYWTPPVPPGFKWNSYHPSFVQLEPIYWNSILNRYRSPLGEYKFKRLLFAKTYLYENFDEILSFAISREPLDRCRSMYFYLKNNINAMRDATIRKVRSQGYFGNHRDDFQLFLEAIKVVRDNPWDDISFATHTASLVDDFTDYDGNALITRVIRQENMALGVERILNEISESPISLDVPWLMKSKASSVDFSSLESSESRLLIQELFGKDFDIYENGE